MKRRDVIAGMGASVTALAAIAGGAAWKFHLFGKHYPPTPYDDLLGQIADRQPAILFGRAAMKTMPGIDARVLAAQLRGEGESLTVRAAADPGQNPAQARLNEVAGWVVPQTVALYAALAAQV